MKKMSRFLLGNLLILILFGVNACQDWNQMDPEAGNQVYPKLVLCGEYEFDSGFSEDAVLINYEGGSAPTVVKDEFKGKVVQLQGGYVQYPNPLNGVSLQTGVSLTMWVKNSEADLNAAIFSFYNEATSENMFFTPNGYLSYTDATGNNYGVNNPTDNVTGLLTVDEWHYLTVMITGEEGYKVYVDGELKLSTDVDNDTSGIDYPSLVQAFSNFTYFYLGYGSSEPSGMLIDDVMVYRNVVPESYAEVPEVSVDNAEPYQFPPRGTVGYYLLDGSFVNSLNESQTGEFITSETQTTISDFEVDAARGTVWHQQEGWAGHDNGWAYTQFTNPLKGQTVEDEGVSVSMWINPPWLNWWDQIFVLNDGTSKFWFNAIGYLGFNGDGGWFDCNQNTDEMALPVGEWTFVTINITTTSFEVYYNGVLKFDNENNAVYAGDMADYSTIISMITASDNWYLGYETWWKAAPALVDDVFLMNRPLTEEEIVDLYADTNKSNGGVVLNPSYLPSLFGVYTLDGTFVNSLNESQSGEFITSETQTTISDFEEDAVRGTVWHQQEGWAGHDNGWAYTQFTNPLKGQTVENDGVSVSMWINPPWLNWWDQIFVLNDGTSKFWFNAIGYLGFNGDGGWFDCNQNTDAMALPVGEWTLVTINVTTTSFQVYYNGVLKFDNENNAVYAGDMADYSTIISMFTASDNWYLGYETWWKAAPALIDDVYLCASPLSEEQALALYNATKK